MRNLANQIILLWGWRRLLVAFIAGALSALALPPFDVFPFLWLSFPVLVWLIDGASAAGGGTVRAMRSAAAVGWFFGFGFFLVGLWWIGVAFFVDAGRFAWLLPFPIVVLPAGLALFFAAAAALARLFWSDGWARILVLAVVLSAAEWLRGHLFTGFPWNAIGYALAPSPVMMQSAALVGLWGLTFFAVLIFAAPALIVSPPRASLGREAVLVAAAALFLAHIGYGMARLSLADERAVPDIHVRIVQPSIAQDEKWQMENADAIFRRFLDLSAARTAERPDGLAGTTYLVWPETAVPYLLSKRPDALAAIGDLLPPGSFLLAGAVRSQAPVVEGDETRYYNSVYALGDDGAILAAYDKVHLVPFGEYLPFQHFLESIGLRQLTELRGGYSAGARRRTLVVGPAPPFGPLICYEIIFPGAAVAADSRPGWLLNLTNDTWFGDTPGPRQHFAEARLRAVEEGLPLVRAANSGISAVVDPYGRIDRYAGVNDVEVIDGDLPAALPPTPYARLGDLVFALLLILATGLAVYEGFTREFRRN